MIRAGLIACALFALTGCDARQPDGGPPYKSDTKQEPSNLTPGIHISGHANVGVVKTF